MQSVLSLIAQTRLVAILRLDDLSQAVELSRALLAGGVVVQEFTLTNPQALSAIQLILDKVEEFRDGRAAIGIGSVRSLAEAEAAMASGAQFLVTPTLQLPVIRAAVERGVPIMPGAFTPTEIATAWEAGAAAVKVFPARMLGPSFIKDVLAPMPYLKLMPTGGIDYDNMQTYLHHGAMAVGIGNQLLDAKAIQSGDWEAITAAARRYALRAAEDGHASAVDSGARR